ncbi:MAG TPA: DUF5676 family membrane protein [Candidatus Paceibacterota bacterium]
MINTKHLLKVTASWISIVYVICFAGVALIPDIRPAFMYYALHTSSSLGENAVTFTSFVTGLVIWNAAAFLAVGLLAVLFNRIKK